jgi:hypothetical protein
VRGLLALLDSALSEAIDFARALGAPGGRGVVGMSRRRRFFLSSLVPAGALISPAGALGARNGSDIPLVGQTTGVITVVLTPSPQGPSEATVPPSLPLHSEFSGQLSVLGRFTGTSDGLFVPEGGVSPFPFTIAATVTLVAADGSELFGLLSGTGVNTGGATNGTNAVRITGGTGRFVGASGSYTESENTVIVSGGSVITADSTSRIEGSLNLGAGFDVRNRTLRCGGDRRLSGPRFKVLLRGCRTRRRGGG